MLASGGSNKFVSYLHNVANMYRKIRKIASLPLERTSLLRGSFYSVHMYLAPPSVSSSLIRLTFYTISAWHTPLFLTLVGANTWQRISKELILSGVLCIETKAEGKKSEDGGRWKPYPPLPWEKRTPDHRLALDKQISAQLIWTCSHYCSRI